MFPSSRLIIRDLCRTAICLQPNGVEHGPTSDVCRASRDTRGSGMGRSFPASPRPIRKGNLTTDARLRELSGAMRSMDPSLLAEMFGIGGIQCCDSIAQIGERAYFQRLKSSGYQKLADLRKNVSSLEPYLSLAATASDAATRWPSGNTDLRMQLVVRSIVSSLSFSLAII